MYQHKIDEKSKILELWVRRKRGNRKLECSGCSRKFPDVYDSRERTVRDLPWSEFRTTVHIEMYRVKCPDCGVKVEKVPLLPSKAPFSKRFEDAVGQACESASARQVARRFGLAESTVRLIHLRYLERWAATRRKPALRQMGVDEIHLERNRSSSRWYATWKPPNHFGSAGNARRKRWMHSSKGADQLISGAYLMRLTSQN